MTHKEMEAKLKKMEEELEEVTRSLNHVVPTLEATVDAVTILCDIGTPDVYFQCVHGPN